MELDDEVDPIVPDPPFEIVITFEHKTIPLLIIPHWDETDQEANFEIFQGQGRVGLIRRNREDVEGWEVVSGEIWEVLVDAIGEKIDDHYFN